MADLEVQERGDCMVSIIVLFLTTTGLYFHLSEIWIFMEELETGHATTTTVDSAICFIISAVLAFVLLNCFIEE